MDPAGYRTPYGCPPQYLPMAGEGHMLRGCWPPSDIPGHVWDTLQAYFDSDRWGIREKDRDCPHTMARFRLCDVTRSQLREAESSWQRDKKS